MEFVRTKAKRGKLKKHQEERSSSVVTLQLHHYQPAVCFCVAGLETIDSSFKEKVLTGLLFLL